MGIRHFEVLRGKINDRLQATSARHGEAQRQGFPWLFGALGQVPSEVMFICENPSFAGVAGAHVDTVDGGEPDIEAQWWGGKAKRFRTALFDLGLKTTPPKSKGGWRCYITNVIKEMNITDDHTRSKAEHLDMARCWADLLKWELECVQPKHVFCVGGSAQKLVKKLMAERRIPEFDPMQIIHYSARSNSEGIVSAITDVVRRELGAR